MAFLYETSFRPSAEVVSDQPFLAKDLNDLLENLRQVLHRISGIPVTTGDGSLYEMLPKSLRHIHPVKNGIKANYLQIWGDTIISYDAEAYGASAKFKDSEIIFGYFFTKPQSLLVLEKVLVHEFLHLILDLPRVMHHGKINDIMRHLMHLPGDPNPLGTVGLECGGF
jgi:hypothetical protein